MVEGLTILHPSPNIPTDLHHIPTDLDHIPTDLDRIPTNRDHGWLVVSLGDYSNLCNPWHHVVIPFGASSEPQVFGRRTVARTQMAQTVDRTTELCQVLYIQLLGTRAIERPLLKQLRWILSCSNFYNTRERTI